MEIISMKYAMDLTDAELVRELEADGAITRKKLARKLRLPLTTVHNRIKRMEREGIIKGYRAIIDKKKIGKGIGAFIDVNVNYIFPDFSQQEIAKKIASMEEVEDVAIITGSTDLQIKAFVSSTDELNEFLTKKLRAIKGVDKTNTAVILQEMRGVRERVLK